MRDAARGFVALAVLLAASAVTLASAQFTAGTELVEVYVSVTAPAGTPVLGLPATAFHVLDMGRPQAISAFVSGDFPLGVVAVVDRSFSMRGARFAAAKAGALRLLDDLRAGDRLEVLALGGTPQTIASPDASREQARRSIGTLALWGTTPLDAAVIASVKTAAPWSGRRAVVLFTDGEQRSSGVERRQALEAARASGVLVYSVAVGRENGSLLRELAETSGGLEIRAGDPTAAARAASAIAADLRHQYLVGFAPGTPVTGWHDLAVSVDAPGAVVRARRGYFAGAAGVPRP